MEVKKENITITLIHGTFAKDNEWTVDGSEFTMLLKKQLSEIFKDVFLNSFTWNGKNSHRERMMEAKRLHEHLQSVNNNNHFVVCHSHGGTIVNYAEKKYGLNPNEVSGIINLATPFLSFEKRILSKSKLFIIYFIPFLISILSLILIDQIDFFEDIMINFPPSLFILLLIIGAFWFIAFRRVYNYLEEYQTDKINELRLIESNIPTLVLFHQNDEVLKLFSIQDKIVSWPFSLWGKYLFIIPLVLFFTLLFQQAQFNFSELVEILKDLIDLNDLGWYLLFFGTLMIIVIITLLLIQFLMLILPLLIIGHKFGFGKTSLWTNLLIKTTGQTKFPWHKEYFMLNEKIKKSLNHSLYNNKRIPEYIFNWIKKELK